MKLLYIAAFLMLFSINVIAATQPDISVIGDFRAFTGNYKDLDGNNTDRNGMLNYQFNSLEIVANGNLNPYTRADFNIANHGDGFELEEGYVTFLRGLPFKMQLRAGQYLVDFGRINILHPHAYAFIDRPLIHRVMFGFEGFNDIGVNASFLLPTSFYSKLSLNLLAGKLFEEHHHAEEIVIEEEHDHHERNSKEPVFSGRLNGFFELGETANLDLGFSGFYGLHQKIEDEFETRKLYTQMGAVDFKFKQKWSDYTALTFMGELIYNQRDYHHETPIGHVTESRSNMGGFTAVDFRFHKRFNMGGKFDYTPGIFDAQEDNDYGYAPDEELNNTPAGRYDEKNSTTAFTFFTGFMLMEETTLIRLAATYMKFNINDSSYLNNTALLDKEDEYTVALQIVWSLGPHKPHDF